jgi:hypothetical protein
MRGLPTCQLASRCRRLVGRRRLGDGTSITDIETISPWTSSKVPLPTPSPADGRNPPTLPDRRRITLR